MNEIEKKIKEICWNIEESNHYDLRYLFNAYINDEFDQYNEDEKHLISEYLKDHVEKKNLFSKGKDHIPGYDALFILITGITTIWGNKKFLTELNNSRLENLKREYFLLINEKEGSLLKERMKYCKELEDDKKTIIKILNLDKLDVEIKKEYIKRNSKQINQMINESFIKEINNIEIQNYVNNRLFENTNSSKIFNR